jgi:D-alanyl-D-alanine carboxypeptidase
MGRGPGGEWKVATVCLLTVCLLVAAAEPAGAAHNDRSVRTGRPPADRTSSHRSSPLFEGLKTLVSMPGGPPGAIALVQTGSQITVDSAGVGDVATGRPIAPDDTVRIASVSKAFNGAVALSLVTHKKLSLTDTIGRLLPFLPRSWAPVTLAELLHHTSGLPDYIHSPAFLDLLMADPHAELTPLQLLSYVTHQCLLFTPGTRYGYSDTDNIVVGLMVETVTHESYEAALAHEVTGRLDLTGTTLPDNPELTEPYVHGYAIEPGAPPEDISTYLNPGLAWASGGMLSTPAELNQFMRAYVRGTFTDPTTRRQQFQFVPGNSGPPGPGTNSAGLAIFRYQTTCGTVYGHTGNFPGYTIFAAATADGSRSITVIVNEQLNDNPVTPVFTQLRAVDGLGVCTALHS